MGIWELIIGIIVLVTIISILEWFLGKVSLPYPVRIAIYAAEAIVAILVVLNLAGYGPHLALR